MAEITIIGGADDATASALVAVVHQVLADEAEAAARPVAAPVPSRWVWSARVSAHWRGPGSPDAPPPLQPLR